MAANSYEVGDTTRLAGAWTNPKSTPNANDPFDPTTIKISYRTPSGTLMTKEFGVGTEIVKDSVGNYYMDVALTESGRWYYRTYSLTEQASDENYLEVEAPVAV